MKLKRWAELSGLLISLATRVSVATPIPILTPIADTRNIFVPVGYDDNDEISVVLDGYIGDTCQKLREPLVKKDFANREIQITPQVERVGTHCVEIMLPYKQVVKLGQVPAGSFRVVTFDKKIVENLTVKTATTIAQDDYWYAPIDSATVDTRYLGDPGATLRGRFTDSCLRMEKTTVVQNGRVLVVLPIMEKTDRDSHGNPCVETEQPFESRVTLPDLAPGRYLLHVRSSNGQSVNHVFNKK